MGGYEGWAEKDSDKLKSEGQGRGVGGKEELCSR